MDDEEYVERVLRLTRRRTVVVPRARCAEFDDVLDLPDLVDLLLRSHRGVAVHAARYRAAYAALGYLARERPQLQVVISTSGDLVESEEPIVYYARRPLRPNDAIVTVLRWNRDDAVEYALGAFPRRAQSTLERLMNAPDLRRVEEAPDLWRAVVLLFARHPELTRVADAYRLLIAHGDERYVLRTAVEAVRDADALVADPERLAEWWPLDVLQEAALSPALVSAARQALADADAERDAMAASVLHLAGVDWRPDGRRPYSLGGAHLHGVAWPELELYRLSLQDADLSRAELTGVQLRRLDAGRATLREATLRGASLVAARMGDVALHGADLTGASLRGAWLERADLGNATLDDADLEGASLSSADLRGASCRRTSFALATMIGVGLAGADFEDACFDDADLSVADLRGARWDGATFRDAKCMHARLDELDLLAPKMAGIDLTQAHLTGARLPGADLSGARLTGAGLAHASLAGADLRGADFSQARFHLGSSRSGKVESTIASEGTRTGFYTDESTEQHFQPPELIRKADLRRADLRGATVHGCDFYLVDLRGAHYEAEQAAHFRACGAIL